MVHLINEFVATDIVTFFTSPTSVSRVDDATLGFMFDTKNGRIN